MRYENWRPRMGLATTAFLLASLLGAIVCVQVPRFLAAEEPQSAFCEIIAPHERIQDLDRLRPSLSQIQRSICSGDLPLDDAITTVDALVSETTIDISVQYFPGADRRERIANMIAYWALSDSMPDAERTAATERIHEQFHKVFGRAPSMLHVPLTTAKVN